MMPSPLVYATQGTRILFSSLKNRFAPKKYMGRANDICTQIVQDCWNGTFFMTSPNNFPQFWTRDFGWCVQSLLKLKYDQEVQATLRYALNRFKKYNAITTTITPGGKPFDFPLPAVDSLPWLVHSLHLAKYPYYDQRAFLNKEVKKFFEKYIDAQTGLVKPELHVSSMKDFAVRKSSCYDNCMVGLLAKDLKAMKLDNLFEQYDYPALIKRHFWSGQYFYDDLTRQAYVAGDANVFPFLFGFCSDESMFLSALKQVQAAGLDQPLPLKYTASRNGINFIAQEILFRDYESDSIWTHLGPLFIKVVHHYDPELAKKYKEKYREVIEKQGNYLEVFRPDGKPFKSAVYYCDAGMLWAANYLTL